MMVVLVNRLFYLIQMKLWKSKFYKKRNGLYKRPVFICYKTGRSYNPFPGRF
jgi:hypothetical protein